MRIKKNGKVITLTESDLNRIVKKVLNEQETPKDVTGKKTSTKIAPILQDYIDNNQKTVPLVTVLTGLDESGEKSPFALGKVAPKDGVQNQKWHANIKKWRKNKDKTALYNIDQMIKEENVVLYPYNTRENSGQMSGVKYVYNSQMTLKLVSA